MKGREYLAMEKLIIPPRMLEVELQKAFLAKKSRQRAQEALSNRM